MAEEGISRAQFLRGDFKGKRHPIRPPWALSESAFTEACTRCGDCLTACPQGILIRARGGFPEVVFRYGECTFCAACVESCPTAALAAEPGCSPWSLKASITERCLAFNGVVCVSCAEACEPEAIVFEPAVGAVSRPKLKVDSCTGCGACSSPCPVDAVIFRYDYRIGDGKPAG